jgi:hypothetical protein
MVRAYAGIAAPLVVLAALVIFGATTTGYDPIRQTISEFGPGFGGTSTVALYGALLATLVWEPIAKVMRPSFSSGMLVASLLAIAIGCVGLNFAPAEPWPWNSMGWQGRLHLIFAFVFVFAAIPAACLFAAGAMPAAWRGLRIYSAATGLGSLALFAGTLAALGGSRADPFVSTHLGLIERVYVFAFLIWQCIVSTRVARSAPRAR